MSAHTEPKKERREPARKGESRTRDDSAAYREQVPAERILNFRTAVQFASEAGEDVPWVAPPWVAAGTITEVVGQPKSAGKTTWILALVRSVLFGEEFMGRATLRSPVVYLTEERPATFREALKRAGLLDAPDLHILEWRDTIGVRWEAVVKQAVAKAEEVGALVVVIDTVSQFAGLGGDSENNSGDSLDTYKVLQEAAANNLAVITVRHERKSGGDVANAGRGSSAFTGAADIVLAIRRADGNGRQTIRQILSLSRFDETPASLFIERTSDGYVVLGDSSAVAVDEAKVTLLTAASSHDGDGPTLEELLERTGVRRSTAQEAIAALLESGQLARTGKGVRKDPYRYVTARQIHSAETPSVRAAGRNREVRGTKSTEGGRVA